MNNETNILIYQTEEGNTKIDVRLENGTVWMTQKAIAELYQTTPQNITLHVKNIYEEGELEEEATCKYYLQVRNEGAREVKIIVSRADATKENMGLTNWKGDNIRKSDVTVAKNYLNEKEIKQLNRIVSMYLDYAESQAERHEVMYMKDWANKLNAFLQFNDHEILQDAGKISAKVAEKLAKQEYGKFKQIRITENKENDFEKFIKKNSLK